MADTCLCFLHSAMVVAPDALLRVRHADTCLCILHSVIVVAPDAPLRVRHADTCRCFLHSAIVVAPDAPLRVRHGGHLPLYLTQCHSGRSRCSIKSEAWRTLASVSYTVP